MQLKRCSGKGIGPKVIAAYNACSGRKEVVITGMQDTHGYLSFYYYLSYYFTSIFNLRILERCISVRNYLSKDDFFCMYY